MAKCEECNLDNGKRSRCPQCNAMICKSCASLGHKIGGNHLVREPGIETAAQTANKAHEFTQRYGLPGEATAERLKRLSEKLNEERIAAKVFKSLRRYLARSAKSHVPQGQGKIFATVSGESRMNMRSRHNHSTNTSDAPYVYVD